MTVWMVIISCLVTGDSASANSRYVRVFDLVSSLPETVRFLGVAEREGARAELSVPDSVYSLDLFPFGQESDSPEVSIFRADMLGPVRAVYAPELARTRSRTDVQGIVFISLVRQDTIIAEVFPFHKEFGSYDDYCVSTDGMKYLLWAPREGPARLLRVIRLLR